MSDRPTFNLVDRPWVPVLRHGEHVPVELSLRECFRQAQQISRVACDPPLIEVALYRLLLAITIDAVGLPSSADEATDVMDEGLDVAAIDAYLDDHRHRFDLFDPTVPFGQVAGLKASNGDVKSVTAMMVTAPSGNNVPLFTPVDDGDQLRLDPAEAAGWLLACQLFDGGGIKSGAVGDPQVRRGKTTGNRPGIGGTFGVTLVEGPDLETTLLLNVPYVPDGQPDDTPEWRRSPAGQTWREREPAGVCDQLTWQSRRLQLCYDGAGTVTGVVVTAGDRSTGFDAAIEPLSTFKYSRRTDEWKPASYRAGVAAWRNLHALLATARVDEPEDEQRQTTLPLQQAAEKLEDHDIRIAVAIYGVVYDSNRASVTDMIADRVPMPLSALMEQTSTRHLLIRIYEDADVLRRALDRLHKDLCSCVSAQPPDWDKGDWPGNRFVHAIDGSVRALLARASEDDPGDLAREWADIAYRAASLVADELFMAFSARVFSGHDEIADDGRTRRHRAAEADRRWRSRLHERVSDARTITTSLEQEVPA